MRITSFILVAEVHTLMFGNWKVSDEFFPSFSRSEGYFTSTIKYENTQSFVHYHLHKFSRAADRDVLPTVNSLCIISF